ncbi:MAG TPA: MaoC/PaaZ C-terminal domain-containing protein [Candidatus Binataceae bacterium]|nr:MaoC/PaaZ C-terminal domain-containing protein [Candidatus Binataceae bacterium]
MKKYSEVKIGDTLGPLEQFVSKEQCRSYAKWMGMEAPRFTDDEGARKEGLPGMILPGNFSLGLLSKFVTDWLGPEPGGRITRISTTYRVPVQPDHTLTFNGFVTHADESDQRIEIDIWIENEEAERLVTGTATVQFSS